MANYWLCITNEDNWNAVKKQNIWGVPEKRGRRLMEKVKAGDYLVFYIMPKRIGGVFRAVSEPFESKKKIFNWPEFGKVEVFPHRVKLEPVAVAKELVSVEELIGKLSFAKRGTRWSAFLRRAMLEITKADYESLHTLLAKK